MIFLCNTEEIPEEGSRGFVHEGKPIFLVRKDGQIHAYLNWCPHLGVSLNFSQHQFLDDQNQFIVCANHGAIFEMNTGQCLSGPCHGKKLVSIRCEEREGALYLDQAPPMPQVTL